MSYYSFERPIKRVAIIGAGPSGVPAARQMLDAGLEVVMFEHQEQVGGVWNYREEAPEPPTLPPPPPSVGAFSPVLGTSGTYPDSDGHRLKQFSPPNPCYWNLTNNVPTKTMAVC